MKSVLKSVMIGVLSVGMLAGCSSPKTETSEELGQTVVAQPVTQPVTQPTNALESQLAQAILDKFRTNMLGWEVGLDEEYKVFYIVLNTSEAMVFVNAKEGNQESIDTVNYLYEEFDLLSETISQSLPDYSLALTNPLDKTLHFYITKNGKAIYDFLND